MPSGLRFSTSTSVCLRGQERQQLQRPPPQVLVTDTMYDMLTHNLYRIHVCICVYTYMYVNTERVSEYHILSVITSAADAIALTSTHACRIFLCQAASLFVSFSVRRFTCKQYSCTVLGCSGDFVGGLSFQTVEAEYRGYVGILRGLATICSSEQA